MASIVVAAATMCALVTGPVPAQAAPRGDYIVVVRPGVSPSAVAASLKVSPSHLYLYSVSGFSAALTDAQISKLAASDLVQSVTPDGVLSMGKKPVVVPPQPAQVVSNAVARVGTLQSPTAHVDGLPDPMPVDVAVLDTGIDPLHPDLNVVGGIDCGSAGKGFQDVEGHGTFVAGLIGARDNAIGVVGVAPDAPLWSVRIANKNGLAKYSDMICGLDWVAQHSDVIRVANMSFNGPGIDTGNCGDAEAKRDQDPVHQAICRVVAMGITFVVSAGNETADASLNSPASYDEVITVSAVTDSDGQPGGLGGQTTCSFVGFDDTFASFSNFGADVDIAAPGSCVRSTWWAAGSAYGTGSGTSFAAPIVAGAAVLYISTHPGATPAQVKEALIDTWEPGPIPDDPDAFPEGIVSVASL